MSQAPVRIIAEAGVNHNGSRETALKLVDTAAAAGADTIKFQTFSAGQLASASAPKAAYQARLTDGDETQLQMLSRLELSAEDHRTIIAQCEKRGIRFLSTPFDSESLALLTDTFGLGELKIGSGELTNAPLLLALARSGRRLILSTGMGSLAEVEEALGVLAFGIMSKSAPPFRAAFSDALHDASAWANLKERVILLHCTTEYPAPVGDTNLRAMDTMHAAFGLDVGYSDHTEGSAISVAAVARGAVMIEKHLTLDRRMKGPDHEASLEPEEFAALVRDVRTVEKAIGTGIKQPSAAEIRNRPVARKSILAARALRAGEVLTADAIAVMRPGGGRSPMDYWKSIGEKIDRDYAEGEPLDP